MNWFEGFLHSVPQYLAHVEAFIDFSEDELIEDGVLHRGTCACLFSVANIDDTTFIPSALKVRQIRGEKGTWFSCSLINRPLFIFVCLQGQGHNIKIPKKQFPVGNEKRSDGQRGCSSYLQSSPAGIVLPVAACTLNPHSRVCVDPPPHVCRLLSGTATWAWH